MPLRLRESFLRCVFNAFRFSSEHYDSELDLVYYNYRHYSPSLGRFLSRDPIEEQGGLNLYAFVGNQLSTQHDILGESMIAPGAGAWYPTLPSWPARPLQADEDSWGVVVAVGQTFLDIIGLIPFVGEFADGANTIIYMCQGDGLSASLSASSMIPIGGQAVAIGKLSNGAKNALEKAHTKLLSISDKEKKSILCSTCGPSSYQKRIPGKFGKEAATDIPSWAKGKTPALNESGRDFAKRLCDEKYGKGNYPTGPGSEFNKLKKYEDIAFERHGQ